MATVQRRGEALIAVSVKVDLAGEASGKDRRGSRTLVERLTASELNRQHHPEARLSRSRSDLDLATMLMDDDVVCDMQAQACASTRSFRSKEGFENARLDLGRDSWPVVDGLDG
jgi:hypothetical protein